MRKYVQFIQCVFIIVAMFCIQSGYSANADDFQDFSKKFITAYANYINIEPDRSKDDFKKYMTTVEELVKKVKPEIIMQTAEGIIRLDSFINDDDIFKYGWLDVNPYYVLIAKLKEIHGKNPPDHVANVNQLLANLYVIYESLCIKDVENSLESNSECRKEVRKQLKGAGDAISRSALGRLNKLTDESRNSNRELDSMKYVSIMVLLSLEMKEK